MENNNAVIIGYASGLGARDHNTRLGPEFFKKHFQPSYDSNIFSWGDMVKHSEQSSKLYALDAIDAVANCCQLLSNQVSSTIRQGKFPIVIGGDHSSAIGTWSGVVVANRDKGNLGLIWVDAHMDSHTVDTSPSGCTHGMPIAALMGYGSDVFTKVGDDKAKLLPENICLIGIRDYEKEEMEFLKRHNVKIYYIDEVMERGFNEVFTEAHRTISSQCDYLGLSVDVDGLCPKDAPGTGTPVGNGIGVQDFLDTVGIIKDDPKFCALEIAEFNPEKDQDNKTLNVLDNIITKTFLP